MLIKRWEAPLLPTIEQIIFTLQQEGLDPFIEEFESSKKVSEHRHPFTEVRVLIKGEMLFNISGNQFLLHPGDRLEIPSNTKHMHYIQSKEDCVCVCAQRVI